MYDFIVKFRRFVTFGFIYFCVIPLFFFIFVYIYIDPFKVIHIYKDYSYSYIAPNRDVVSTCMFKNNFRKYKYNSFVFGSSRTLAFRPKTWQSYLDKGDNIFMFDASAESITGIYMKIKYLDSLNVHLKNVLIVICRDCSFTVNRDAHLFIKHPDISNKGYLFFHFVFFKAFLDPNFLYSLFSYKIFGCYKPFMSGYIENRKIKYDTLTNELRIIDVEKELEEDMTAYYKKNEHLFYLRSGECTDSVRRINWSYFKTLVEIKKLLSKNNTKYKIVLSPLYDQVNFKTEDLFLLRRVCAGSLYDFTGENMLTSDKFNYYESSHYRSKVGDSILKYIYKPDF